MKNQIKHIITLTFFIGLLFGKMSIFAMTTEGDGTKENPFTSVDFTGEEQSFVTWAAAGNDGEGYYFSPECTFRNLTSVNGKVITFLPVYDSVNNVTVYASGGTIGGETEKIITVNFTDGTIEDDKEVLEQDETKRLGSVLAELPEPVKSGYYPYFYEYDSSVENKRLYFGESIPAGILTEEGTAVKISDGLYDREGDLYVVYSDTEDATAWKESITEASKMIAYREGYDKDTYAEKFGGLSTLPYGTFTAKKELPGAVNLTCSWSLKKGGEQKASMNTETFTGEKITKDLDEAVLTEVLHYGPGSCYSLTTIPIIYTVYARPEVSAAVIE